MERMRQLATKMVAPWTAILAMTVGRCSLSLNSSKDDRREEEVESDPREENSDDVVARGESSTSCGRGLYCAVEVDMVDGGGGGGGGG